MNGIYYAKFWSAQKEELPFYENTRQVHRNAPFIITVSE